MKHQYPNRRQEKLVVRELADETLVYDLARHKALCLNVAAAAVWKRCDGKATPQQLARELGMDVQAVWCALDQLGKDGLLEGRPTLPSGLAGLNRRQQLKLLGKVAAVTIPLVTAVTAPTAAEAATCLPSGATCGISAQCCSGICSGSVCA